MPVPKILQAKPAPKVVKRQFHGRSIPLYDGMVQTTNVSGWVDNPRIDVHLNYFRENNAGRDPNQDELLFLMENDKDFKLKELAEDIRINGVRIPIILTHSGKLLDGNRRYFALRSLLNKLPPEDPLRDDLSSLRAWVLGEEATDEDERTILVQENFYPAMKVEWTDYVKAQRIYKDLNAGLPIEAVARRYGWDRGKVSDTKKIMELVEEFISFATSDGDDEEPGLGMNHLEAEAVAADKYQFFNEAKKSLLNDLNSDIDFKLQFFRWLAEGKFSSFAEVRMAGKAWKIPQAKRILMGNEPRAAKKAKAVVDFLESGAREVRSAAEMIDDFGQFLLGLSTAAKQSLSPESLTTLKTTLETVVGMIERSSDARG